MNAKEGRDEGWDVRKGALSANSTNGRGHRKVWRDGRLGRAMKATGANGEAVKPKDRTQSKEENAGPLHPSWEAARKRKSQGQRVMNMFQGKKISFD
jgi:hypothetical protein